MRSRALQNVFVKNVSLGRISGAFIFAVALSLSAFIKIPLVFTPVPVTLQNLVVFLSGAILGPVFGMAAVGLYILIGVLGAPLFANSGAGLLYIFGPTGGYFIGFLVAACFTGCVTRNKRVSASIVLLYAAMLCSVVIIYLFGGAWLAVGFGWNFSQVLFLGAVPFLVPDVLKAFIAAVIIKNILR